MADGLPYEAAGEETVYDPMSPSQHSHYKRVGYDTVVLEIYISGTWGLRQSPYS